LNRTVKRSGFQGPLLTDPSEARIRILPYHPLPNDLIAVFFSFRFLWQFGYVHGTQWYVVLQDVSMSW
jgi:hypothetical protein